MAVTYHSIGNNSGTGVIAIGFNISIIVVTCLSTNGTGKIGPNCIICMNFIRR